MVVSRQRTFGSRVTPSINIRIQKFGSVTLQVFAAALVRFRPREIEEATVEFRNLKYGRLPSAGQYAGEILFGCETNKWFSLVMIGKVRT